MNAKQATADQLAFLATAGAVYAALLGAPGTTEAEKAEGWSYVEFIVRQARTAGLSDVCIAGATRLPIFLIVSIP